MEKTGVCGRCENNSNTEWHHIIFKSRCEALKNCGYNLIELCVSCHRGNIVGAHHNNKTDEYLKTRFKSFLEEIIKHEGDKIEVTKLKEWLEISEKEVNKLCKTLKRYNGKISIEELIINIGLGGL